MCYQYGVIFACGHHEVVSMEKCRVFRAKNAQSKKKKSLFGSCTSKFDYCTSVKSESLSQSGNKCSHCREKDIEEHSRRAGAPSELKKRHVRPEQIGHCSDAERSTAYQGCSGSSSVRRGRSHTHSSGRNRQSSCATPKAEPEHREHCDSDHLSSVLRGTNDRDRQSRVSSAYFLHMTVDSSHQPQRDGDVCVSYSPNPVYQSPSWLSPWTFADKSSSPQIKDSSGGDGSSHLRSHTVSLHYPVVGRPNSHALETQGGSRFYEHVTQLFADDAAMAPALPFACDSPTQSGNSGSSSGRELVKKCRRSPPPALRFDSSTSFGSCIGSAFRSAKDVFARFAFALSPASSNDSWACEMSRRNEARTRE